MTSVAPQHSVQRAGPIYVINLKTVHHHIKYFTKYRFTSTQSSYEKYKLDIKWLLSVKSTSSRNRRWKLNLLFFKVFYEYLGLSLRRDVRMNKSITVFMDHIMTALGCHSCNDEWFWPVFVKKIHLQSKNWCKDAKF